MSVGSIGTITLDMILRERQMTRTLDRLPSVLERAGGRMRSIAAGISAGIASALTHRLIDAVGRGLASAVGTGAEFERAMSGVLAVTQATEAEMRRLSDMAIELGRTTSFSAQQVAEAMYELGQAGFRTNQILAAQPHILNLAAAGDLQLKEAADIAAAAMNNMGISANHVGRVADILAKASIDSATDVRELGVAFSYAAPTANAFGKTLIETVAPMEILANAGIRAERAGTGLRQVLTDLSGASREANRLFKELGIDINAFSLLPLSEQIDELNRRMAGMTGPEKAGKLVARFGDRSGPVMLALMNQGGAALRAIEAALLGAGGTAARVAEQRLENVAGAWRKFSGAVAATRIRFFEAIAEPLRRAIDRATAWVNDFTEDLPAMMGRAIEFTKAQWQAWSPVVRQAIDTAAAALEVLRQAASGLGTLLRTALDAAGYSGSWGDFRDIVLDVLRTLQFAFENIPLLADLAWTNVKAGLSGVADSFYNTFNTIGAFLKQFWDNLVSLARWAGGVVVDIFKWVGDQLSAIIDAWVQNFRAGVGRLADLAKIITEADPVEKMRALLRLKDSFGDVALPQFTAFPQLQAPPTIAPFRPPPGGESALTEGLRREAEVLAAKLSAAMDRFMGEKLKPPGEADLSLDAIQRAFAGVTEQAGKAWEFAKGIGLGLWDGFKAEARRGEAQAAAAEDVRASFTSLPDAWKQIQQAAFGKSDPQDKLRGAVEGNTDAVEENTAAIREMNRRPPLPAVGR